MQKIYLLEVDSTSSVLDNSRRSRCSLRSSNCGILHLNAFCQGPLKSTCQSQRKIRHQRNRHHQNGMVAKALKVTCSDLPPMQFCPYTSFISACNDPRVWTALCTNLGCSRTNPARACCNHSPVWIWQRMRVASPSFTTLPGTVSTFMAAFVGLNGKTINSGG